MFKSFTKIVAQGVVLALLIEGFKAAQWLLNRASDGAIFGGFVTLVASLYLFIYLSTFIWRTHDPNT